MTVFITKNRFDYDNQWQGIKETWIDLYTNNTVKAGFSEVYKVSANDEWCAEAYMETDYSTLSKDDFTETLKKYVAFDLLNR